MSYSKMKELLWGIIWRVVLFIIAAIYSLWFLRGLGLVTSWRL